MSSAEPGAMLLHYRLVEKIASGGMGDVYKAEDNRLGRTVALKLLPPGINEDVQAKRRFMKEDAMCLSTDSPLRNTFVQLRAVQEVVTRAS